MCVSATGRFVVALFVPPLILTCPVFGQAVDLISQERVISTFLLVSQCEVFVEDRDQADGFDPFESSLHAGETCEAASAALNVTQTSTLGTETMTAFAAASFSATAEIDDLIVTIAESSFEVTFEVRESRAFDLTGAISAKAATGPQSAGAGQALVRLSRLDGDPLFEHDVSQTVGRDARPLADAGRLDPGTYTLEALAFGFLDDSTPSDRSGEATFDFTLELRGAFCEGDLDGDGLVGLSDLATLLANFGTAMGADPEDGDLDGDGDVDLADLAALLAVFGTSCP